jgi:hypothetical protein
MEEKPAESVVTTNCGVDTMRGGDGARPVERVESAGKLSLVIETIERCRLIFMAGFSARVPKPLVS